MMFDVTDIVRYMQTQAPAADALWVRQSTIGSWELCPGRVGHSTHPGFNNLPSEAMSFGTLEHAIIEADLSSVFGRVNLTTLDVIDLWGTLVRDEYSVELEDLASDELIESSAKEALGAFHLWLDEVRPHLPGEPEEWIAEKRLEAFMGWLDNGREVWLHGTADLLVPSHNKGFDWKTAGRGWKDTKATFIGQASCYTYLSQQDLDVEIRDWDYWVYDRAKMVWSLHHTERNDATVAAWLRHAWNVAKAIDAGAFPYYPTRHPYGKSERGWHCSAKYCGAWRVCPGKYLADDVDETELVVTTWS